MDVGQLRFTEAQWKKARRQAFVLALQKNTDYFYLWASSPDARAGGKPLCDGHLLDIGGSRIGVDSIMSFAMADFEGNGSTYIVALLNGGRSVSTWKLDSCEGKATFAPIATTAVVAAGEVRGIYNRLIAGDFRDAGSDDIQLLGGTPLGVSEWRLSPGGFVPLESHPLVASSASRTPVNEIRYVTTTRLRHTAENVAYETATVILHDRGYTIYRSGEPIYYAPNCDIAPANCRDRILLFNLDQGFSDGLQDMARKDALAASGILNRVMDGLRIFQPMFRVWVLVNPIQEDRGATLRVLDTLSNAGIPFVLDYYSSDVTTLAGVKKNSVDYSPRAYDGLKGLSLALEGDVTEPDNLAFFARRYGRNFVGVRLMERLGMDIQVSDQTFPQMVSDRTLAQAKLSFDWELAGRLLDWAKAGGRFVIWADPALYLPYECYWSADEVAQAAARRDSYVSRQQKFAANNPYVVPMYDNNEGLKRCGVAKNTNQSTPRNFRLTDWERIPRSVAGVKTGRELLTGPQGFGISVQSWTSDFDPILAAGTLPPEEMAIWILDALNKGAGIVELEPYFYLFDWPQGMALPQSRPIPPRERVGDPRDTFKELVKDVMGKVQRER